MPTRHKRKSCIRHFYSALLTNHAGRHKYYSMWPTNVLIAYRVLIVYKNTVDGEIWCSFLSTHAFLLGNGQTYATRGAPYYRVSRKFMSRIFHPCNMVPHFHVPQFHVSHFQRPPQFQREAPLFLFIVVLEVPDFLQQCRINNTLCPKNVHLFLFWITLSKIDRF